MEHNISLFLSMTPVIIGAILLGAGGCIVLYKGDYRGYLRSSLFIKTFMWLPLYITFCFVCTNVIVASLAAALLIGCSVFEWRKSGLRKVIWYLLYFMVGCVMIPISQVVIGPGLLMTIVLASVMSDVAAFFFGKTAGRHHLPAALNRNKTYEGVIGQIVGGVVGMFIASLMFGVSAAWWYGIVIGALSATGDLANSFVKRKISIESWGHTIPGHGGVMDRFSSMFAVIIITTIIRAI